MPEHKCDIYSTTTHFCNVTLKASGIQLFSLIITMNTGSLKHE